MVVYTAVFQVHIAIVDTTASKPASLRHYCWYCVVLGALDVWLRLIYRYCLFHSEDTAVVTPVSHSVL